MVTAAQCKGTSPSTVAKLCVRVSEAMHEVCEKTRGFLTKDAGAYYIRISEGPSLGDRRGSDGVSARLVVSVCSSPPLSVPHRTT